MNSPRSGACGPAEAVHVFDMLFSNNSACAFKILCVMRFAPGSLLE